jgi:hypothetical protein
MKTRINHNGDDIFIAWKSDGFIPHGRGFAMQHLRNGNREFVKTWVGFAGEPQIVGERRDSKVWPIQKYQRSFPWSKRLFFQRSVK